MSRFVLSMLAVVGATVVSSGAIFAQHGHQGGHGGGHASGHGGGHYGGGHAYSHGGSHYGGHAYSTPIYSYAPQYVSVAAPSCGSSYQSYTPTYQSYAPAYGSGHAYLNTSYVDYHAPSVQIHRNYLHVNSGHYNHHGTGHHY